MSEERKVFVSYSRADKDKVLPLVKSLEKSVGTMFWIDLDGIESSAKFEDVIMKAIKNAEIVLFMLSRNSLNSDWTKREVLYAEKQKKRIVPVVLDDGVEDGWFSFHFADINYIDSRVEDQRKRLTKDLKQWLQIPNEDSERDKKDEAIHKDFIKKLSSARMPDHSKQKAHPKSFIHKLVDLISGRTNAINGHKFVDMGPEICVKWSTCNIGANRSSDYGNYYAWGETLTKSTYTESNSVAIESDSIGNDISGNPAFDVASAEWGQTWRMPTLADFCELLLKCDWKWTSQDGHHGYKVTSKTNGNSIFLPASGRRDNASLAATDMAGFYWTSNSPDGFDNAAYSINFFNSGHSWGVGSRHVGCSIRPVSD